jgi:SAM-dependent methyltransferase
MSNERYVLPSGDEAERRLAVVDSVHGPDTHLFLSKVCRLQEGLSVADIGCGVGTVSCWMAGAIDAIVTGVDASEAQIRTANARRDRLFREELRAVGNVTFLQGSAYGTGLEPESFDMVYSRFVLMHLQRPADAIAEMQRLLKPGGILALEDGDFDSPFCYPPCAAYDRAFELYRLAGAQHGADFNIGRKLFGLVTAAGFENAEVQLAQPAYTRGDARRLPEWTLAESAASLIEAGLSSREEINSLLADLERYAADETNLIAMARVAQVSARKRES